MADPNPSTRLAAIVFGAALVLSGTLLLSVLPTGPAAAGQDPPSTKLAFGLDQTARNLLDLTKPDDEQLDRATLLSRKALQQWPGDVSALLHIAQAEQMKAGEVNEPTKSALRRSYAVAPIDPQLGPWRVSFCLTHWSQMDPGLRQSVEAEFRAFAARHGHRRTIINAVRDIPDLSGRLAVTLWINKPLHSSPALKNDGQKAGQS